MSGKKDVVIINGIFLLYTPRGGKAAGPIAFDAGQIRLAQDDFLRKTSLAGQAVFAGSPRQLHPANHFARKTLARKI